MEPGAAEIFDLLYLPFIKKVCEFDALLCQCGGKLKPIALIDDPNVIYRIHRLCSGHVLKHRNLLETETEQPPLPPELLPPEKEFFVIEEPKPASKINAVVPVTP